MFLSITVYRYNFYSSSLAYLFDPGPKAGISGERLDRMEEDLRRLSQGLDTLNSLVAGLEDRLHVSLREDTTKMLTTLLGAPRRPDSSVGFGVIPEGTPDVLGSSEGFPVLGDLVGRVTEVKDELRAKSNILDEIHACRYDFFFLRLTLVSFLFSNSCVGIIFCLCGNDNHG